MVEKLNYETPEIEVFTVKLEGCIAVSETEINVNDPFSEHTEEESG